MSAGGVDGSPVVSVVDPAAHLQRAAWLNAGARPAPAAPTPDPERLSVSSDTKSERKAAKAAETATIEAPERRALSKLDILGNAPPLPMEDVPVPEWAPGGFVTVRGMTGADRAAVEAAVAVYQEAIRAAATGKDYEGNAVPDPTAALARVPSLHCVVAQRCTVERATGERLFGVPDVAALEQKHAGPLSRIYDAAMRLSKLTKADREALERDSARTTGDSSGSSSR